MTEDTFSVIYLTIPFYLQISLTSPLYKGVTLRRGEDLFSLHLETIYD